MRYLSKEWIAAADAAVRANAANAPTTRLTIDQHVGSDLKYRVVVEQNASSVSLIDDSAVADSADAVFSQSRETAKAIALGDTDAHQAFLLGHITYSGNVSVLIQRRDAFAWLQDALAPVIAATSFD